MNNKELILGIIGTIIISSMLVYGYRRFRDKKNNSEQQ